MKAKEILVDNRYLIYIVDGGVIYDTLGGKDIPPYVFEIRDSIMGNKIRYRGHTIEKKTYYTTEIINDEYDYSTLEKAKTAIDDFYAENE